MKKYRIRTFSPLWWIGAVGGTMISLFGMIAWVYIIASLG